MRRTVRFLLALAVALVLMLCFRALAFTIYTIDGGGLSPQLCKGDRVLVNRWSYGLRVGGDDWLFNYTRIARQPVERGDIVAFQHPNGSNEVLICRCKAVPGDTIHHEGQTIIVPGRVTCAETDQYWVENIGTGNVLDSRSLGFISEALIIGRVTTIVYSHDPEQPFWKGWRRDRFLLSL